MVTVNFRCGDFNLNNRNSWFSSFLGKLQENPDRNHELWNGISDHQRDLYSIPIRIFLQLTEEATEPRVPIVQVEVTTSEIYGHHLSWLILTEYLCHKWQRNHQRDLYSICRCFWNLATYKWKVHNGKIEIISFVVVFILTGHCCQFRGVCQDMKHA
jgi:hypothetical protein